MSDQPYTEADVRIVASKLCDRRVDWHHHDRTDDYPCSGCQEDARAVLDALAAARRLLPEGASVVEQLGVRVDVAHPGRPEKVGDVITHWGDATCGAPQYWHGWTRVRRDTADWRGPWTPVDADLVPPPTINEESTDA